MDKRRVRFAIDASPTSTNESSLGPITPPQYAQSLVFTEDTPRAMPHFQSPFIPGADSFASPNQSQLHRALAKPTFDFDVSIHPSANPSIHSSIELQTQLKSPMAELHVHCLILESRHLPWRITISTDGQYLTALDSLVGIYNNLRIRASQVEFERQSLQKQDEISAAFYDRVERRTPPELREQERRKGLRRVDFLPLNSRYFNGIDVGKGSNPWVVHFRR